MRGAVAFWGVLILGLGLGWLVDVPGAGAVVVAPPAGAVVVGTSSASCPSTFATINAAIAAVPAGSTIYVCSGTYSEAVSVTKNVTLLGAQYGVSATTGRTDPSQETIIDSPGGADVTYDGASTGTLAGFSLIGNNTDSGNNDGIDAFEDAGQSGFTWTDNVITETSTGINFRADGPAPTTISANRITGNTETGGTELSNGIFFTNGAANDVTISGNVFGGQGTDLNTTGSGSSTGPLSQNLVVSDNTSADSQNFVVLFLTDDAVVSHNTVGWTDPNDPGAGSAIAVFGGDIAPTIDANTIDGGDATAIRVDTLDYNPSSAVTIANNTIVNRLNGVRVDQNAALTATSSITGNTVADAGVGDGVGPGVIGGNGIWLQSGTGVVVSGNAASGSFSTDCRDETAGTGTAGTANAWTSNSGTTSSPPGLCVAPAITVAKTADPGIVQKAGQLVTYRFLVTNDGNGPLSGISVADTFTAPSTGSLTPTCPRTTLAAGASMTCTTTYAVTQVDVDHGAINDSATATGTPASGPPVTSAPSTASVSAPPSPGIALAKAASVSSYASAGTPVTYSYTVTNIGNVTLNPVTVSDPMVGLSLISCPTESLAPGVSETCTATYKTTTVDVKAGSITNTATATGTPPVSAANPSPKPVTATSTATVTRVSPGPPTHDLTVTKTASRRHVVVGRPVTYTIVVRNLGPDAASAARIIDTSGPPAKIRSIRTTAGKCTTGRPLRCALGTIRAGARVTIKVVSTPTKPGRLRNVVSVSSTGRDTNPTNNHASVVVIVKARRLAALQLHKRASVRTALPGADVTYLITVTNPNAVAARRVSVCDTLPAGEQFDSARPSAHPSGEAYCWTADRLNPGITERLKLTVSISSRHVQRLVNHATARARGLPETSHAVAAISVKPAPIAPCISASQARANSTKIKHPVGRAAC
jgi:uncharacterized repeat protein (TIGR01451 family)